MSTSGTVEPNTNDVNVSVREAIRMAAGSERETAER